MKKPALNNPIVKDPPERESKLKSMMTVTEEDSQFVLNLAKTIFGENFNTNKPISFYNSYNSRGNNKSSPGKLPHIKNDSQGKKIPNNHNHTLSSSIGNSIQKNYYNNPTFSLLARSAQDFSKIENQRAESENFNKVSFRESLYGHGNVKSEDNVMEIIDQESPRNKEFKGKNKKN